MKIRLSALLLAVTVTVGMLAGCGAPQKAAAGEEKLQIVATLFPQYDFARQIAGEKADVTLLLPPGVESHSYEPTPQDIIKINKASLFVYTGKFMEPWAAKIVEGIGGETVVLDISENIPLDAEDDPEEAEEHGGFDPHVWTDPEFAKMMVDNLTNALSAADPVNAGYYQQNATAYKTKLDELDAAFREVAENSKRKELVFGGRFAMHYFAQRYSLTYRAAFDSCSHEAEPSARVIAEIVDEVKTKKIPVVFYEELTDPKVARSIAEETGAKLLLLHSCHNVSKEELQNGATYLSLMWKNVENLKEGLN